jgi:S-DNA-T family DNA segregation ATPase FtsK/SpoIIIE
VITLKAGLSIQRQTLELPLPGWDGKHWLVAGSTGAGKTNFILAMLGQLSAHPHVAWAISDPAYMDYEPTVAARASTIALGIEGAEHLLERVETELHRRLREGRRLGVRVLPVNEEWPYVLAVWDELAMLTQAGIKGADKRLVKIAQVGRKVRIGMLLATQSPKASVIPMLVREQCPIRVCFRTEEDEQTEAVLGTRKWRAHDIPATQPGRGFVRDDRGVFTEFRAFFMPDDEVAEVCRRHAGLTPELDPEHGWHRIYDPFEQGAAA